VTNPTLTEAYDHCRKIATSHYENFPVGSVLIPRKLRKHFFALYAFMRTADDFADLPNCPSEERLKLLADWRTKLHSIYQNEQPSDPIFLALQDTIQKFNLAIQPFDLLLDAFEFDARGNVRLETYDDLYWYTKHSAEPVGQLVLALFGYRDEERIGWSNDICTALQLINFLQDAKEDLTNQRYYFPREDFMPFGISRAEDIAVSSRSHELVIFECDRIDKMLVNGAALPESVNGRLRLELRAVLAGARMMSGKIRTMNGNTIEARPTLSSLEKMQMLLAALKKSGGV
jgi:squalene synthase HpnC